MQEHGHKSSRSKSPKAIDGRARRRSWDRHDRSPDSKRSLSHPLPFNVGPISKHDLCAYRPMFALYLDIQKNLDLEDLDEKEVKGRWKSFVNKWNRGELASGWYDPATLAKAIKSLQDPEYTGSSWQKFEQRQSNKPSHEADDVNHSRKFAEDEEGDDEYGPSLPQSDLQISAIAKYGGWARAGPTIPTIQDLQARDEDSRTAANSARIAQKENNHHERKQERKSQREHLEDVAPRAAAGTRDRQIEKREDIRASNREFAASKDADTAEMQDRDLMGEDTTSELKRVKREQERRKTEREIRREEILRARTAEREERVRHMREKEDKTMSMLREIARERFGDGNVQPAILKSD